MNVFSLPTEAFCLFVSFFSLIPMMKVRCETDNLEEREIALKAKETQKVQQELKAAKSQIDNVVQEFENQLRTANFDEFNSLIRKSESAINSIVKAHRPGDSFYITETDTSSYQPQSGEQVYVKGLGNKLAAVVEATEDENTVLVQYGKIRVRVEKSNVRPISSSKRKDTISSRRSLKRQVCNKDSFLKHVAFVFLLYFSPLIWMGTLCIWWQTLTARPS